MRRLSIVVPLALLFFACASDPADPPADLNEGCAEGRIACGATCVDPRIDPANCGACGNACAADEVCGGGSCRSGCEAGTTACGASCVDTSSDPAHCGTCGNACAAGFVCDGGSCACPDGLAACDGACVNTALDPENCGACGTACGAGESCVDGSCAPGCTDGRTMCSGACTDTSSDTANCGGCGVACAAGQRCEGGTCACPDESSFCDGVCVDTATDAVNCGACGVRCASEGNANGAACVDGACALVCPEGWADCDGDVANGCEVELAADAGNCGACDNVCGEGASCESGLCCADSHLVCGDACVDPASDAQNCGGCGNTCLGWPGSTGGACVDGSCVLACDAGASDCNADPADGCETETSNNPVHCGGCGLRCGALCGDGACLSVSLPERTFYTLCTLVSDGSVYCWGWNPSGQVGDGGTANVNAPVRVPIGRASTVAMGENHTCAVLADGGVACWGKNDRGQLGNGNTTATLVPQTVAGLSGATELALTDSSSCALLASGGVTCWGGGTNGRLGNGDTADALAPVEVTDGTAPLADVVEIASGLQHVCARTSDGTVRCWGGNLNGQLGAGDRGNSTSRSVATLVPGLAGVDQIAASGYRTCARVGGAVKCWGQNNLGQAGDGTSGTGADKVLPADVTGIATAVDVRIAQNHSCALLADGSARCWGLNTAGQLGDGTITTATTPVVLQDPSGVGPWMGLTAVLPGGAHTCALQDDDELLCWGDFTYSQLGDGSTCTALPCVAPNPVKVRW